MEAGGFSKGGGLWANFVVLHSEPQFPHLYCKAWTPCLAATRGVLRKGQETGGSLEKGYGSVGGWSPRIHTELREGEQKVVCGQGELTPGWLRMQTPGLFTAG